MRTTLDLPDPLMREVKARAALEGLKLKEYFANLVQAALQRPVGGSTAATQRSAAPVFDRAHAKRIPAMGNAQLSAIMDAEDAARYAAQ
jgi:hypothetical protein